jgi:hypothetical protein
MDSVTGPRSRLVRERAARRQLNLDLLEIAGDDLASTDRVETGASG